MTLDVDEYILEKESKFGTDNREINKLQRYYEEKTHEKCINFVSG